MQDATFHFSATDRFTCNDCGHCCTSGLRVAVDTKTLTTLVQSPCYLNKVREGYNPIDLADPRGPSIGLQANGHCAFHLDQGCEIHSTLGADAKPVACRTYPYNLVDTPDGVFVSLSYTCPVAVSGAGSPLHQNLPQLAKLVNIENVKERPFAEILSARVQITNSQDCDWGDYLILEDKIKKSFKASDPVGYLLSCATSLIEHGELDPSSFREYDYREFPRCLAEARKLLEVLTDASLHILKETTNKPELREALHGMTENRKHAPKEPSNQRGSLPPDLMTSEVVERYFRSLLYGKRMTTPTVATKLLSLAVALEIVLSLQSQMLKLATTPHFSFQDLSEAINFVELEILSHSRDLDAIFSEFEAALAALTRLS